MKFSKDQIQKLALSAMGFAVLLYVYFNFFLGPLNKSRAAAEKTINDLQAKLSTSKAELSKAAGMEKEASAATTRFAALKGLNPEGAPIAWFPPRMKLFFAQQQVDKATARLDGNSAYKQPELVEWMKYIWLIDLPQTDFVSAGKAIAELENSEPLLAISKISVKAGTDDPQFQQVTLTANTAIMKQ